MSVSSFCNTKFLSSLFSFSNRSEILWKLTWACMSWSWSVFSVGHSSRFMGQRPCTLPLHALEFAVVRQWAHRAGPFYNVVTFRSTTCCSQCHFSRWKGPSMSWGLQPSHQVECQLCKVLWTRKGSNFSLSRYTHQSPTHQAQSTFRDWGRVACISTGQVFHHVATPNSRP